MKRVTGLSLALVFIIYLIGMEAYYSFRLGVAKNQSSELINNHEISKENTTMFSFTADQYKHLDWSERNKEFTYNGRHYDIISLQFCTDKITLTCYNDRNETDLVDSFTGFVKHMFSQTQSSNNSNNDIVSKICKEYLPPIQIPKLFFFHVLTTIKADCVLVNHHAPIAAIWHPPTMA